MLTPQERMDAMSIIARAALAMEMNPDKIDEIRDQAAEAMDQYLAKME